MKNRLYLPFFLWLLMAFTCNSFAQGKPAYKLYNAKGNKVTYKKMLRQISKQEVILFGELHNNAIAHWLQLAVTKDLAKDHSLVLGAEMIETDNQLAINQYLSGQINQQGLDTLARLWPNYPTDYAPLVNWAKENNRPFIATNIPRRYARLVHRHDFQALDTLPPDEKQWIAPLPIPYDSTLPQYENIMTMMGGHGSPTLVKAQAIKDATMAYHIQQHRSDATRFIHFNGAYHSDFYEGINWYLQHYAPNLTIATITTVTQTDIGRLAEEHKGKADFIICVDETVTTTY